MPRRLLFLLLAVPALASACGIRPAPVAVAPATLQANPPQDAASAPAAVRASGESSSALLPPDRPNDAPSTAPAAASGTAPETPTSSGRLPAEAAAPPDSDDEEAAGDVGHESAAFDALLALGDMDLSSPPAPDVRSSVEADLAATSHDIPIPLNDRVLRFVGLFQGRLRNFLAEGLNRGAAHIPMIQGVLRAEKLPLDLAYLPLVESAFKTTALSRASARGVWQFMAGTATENGLRADYYVDERATTDKATRAAARYLKTLHGMFGGDWHLALASYNSGPGRVQRALRRNGATDFWRLTTSRRRTLPRETRDYVPMVLAAMVIARNPSHYGFEIAPPAPEPLRERVTLPGPVDLRQVAEWLSVAPESLQQLNPELRRGTTPPIGNEPYELRVPAGTALTVLERYMAAAPDELDLLPRHTVRRGESLASIARKVGVRRTELAQANYLRTNARVRPGQDLVLPRRPPASRVASRARSTGDVARTSLNPSADRQPSRAAGPLSYRIRAGDTLYSIARRHGVTVGDLQTWNRLRSTHLRIGAVLTIRVPQTVLSEQ